jgi:hypothetical protein
MAEAGTEEAVGRRRWSPKERALERAWLGFAREELPATEIICRLYDESDDASCRKIAAAIAARFSIDIHYTAVNRLLTEGLRRREELGAGLDGEGVAPVDIWPDGGHVPNAPKVTELAEALP